VGPAGRRLGDDALLARALSLSARAELVDVVTDTGIRIIDEAIAAFARLDDRPRGWRVPCRGLAGGRQRAGQAGEHRAALPLLDRAADIAGRGIEDDPAGDASTSSIPATSALADASTTWASRIGMGEMSGAM